MPIWVFYNHQYCQVAKKKWPFLSREQKGEGPPNLMLREEVVELCSGDSEHRRVARSNFETSLENGANRRVRFRQTRAGGGRGAGGASRPRSS